MQRRVWQFDIRQPEARAALGAALDGQLPGTLEVEPAVDGAKMVALREQQRDESLPPGVCSVLTEVGQQTEWAVGVAALRPLASTGLAAGLGLSHARFEGTHGVAVAQDRAF